LIYTGDYIVEIVPKNKENLELFFEHLFSKTHKILEEPKIHFILRKRKNNLVLREADFGYEEWIKNEIIFSLEGKNYLNFDLHFIPEEGEDIERFLRLIFNKLS